MPILYEITFKYLDPINMARVINFLVLQEEVQNGTWFYDHCSGYICIQAGIEINVAVK